MLLPRPMSSKLAAVAGTKVSAYFLISSCYGPTSLSCSAIKEYQ